MSDTEKVVVVVRVRPLNEREKQASGSKTGQTTLSVHDSQLQLYGKCVGKEDRAFSYDHVFWSADDR